MNKCEACECYIDEGTVCDTCFGWEFLIKEKCFLCGIFLARDTERYLKRGNVCFECDKKVRILAINEY